MEEKHDLIKVLTEAHCCCVTRLWEIKGVKRANSLTLTEAVDGAILDRF